MKKIDQTVISESSVKRRVSQAYFNQQLFSKMADQLADRLREIAGVHPIFEVYTTGLFKIYIRHFESPADRQYHRCNCCQRFIDNFGALVYVDESGKLRSAFWDESLAPRHYKSLVKKMRETVESRTIVSAKIFDLEKYFGDAQSGGFGHFYAHQSMLNSSKSAEKMAKDPLYTAYQVQAHISHEKETMDAFIARSSARLHADTLKTLKRAVTSKTAVRSDEYEKVISNINWIEVYRKASENERWAMIYNAPIGFATPAGGLTGFAISACQSKTPDSAIRSINEKLDPLKFKRVQSGPSEGNIKQANAAFEKLGLESALKRRYATIDDIPHNQRLYNGYTGFSSGPNASVDKSGIFSTLEVKSKSVKKAERVGDMTWNRFTRMYAYKLQDLQIKVPHSGPFAALTTAVDKNAERLIGWDLENDRNPVAWYLYATAGRFASRWNLQAGDYANVYVVCNAPSQWTENMLSSRYSGIFFGIRGAADSSHSGLALFPEIIRSDLHQFRNTIENFSKQGSLVKVKSPVCGLMYSLESQLDLEIMFKVDGDWYVTKITTYD